MVNQELTNRKVMEEAQKLESKYGIVLAYGRFYYLSF
jgi:hypothetical protein